MRIRCYSVYDRKTLAYHPPFYAPTDGAAVRTLSDAMADPNMSLSRHPADYVLYYVGEFDDQSGQMWPEQPLHHVVDLVALVKQQPELPLADSNLGHTGELVARGLANGQAAKVGE